MRSDRDRLNDILRAIDSAERYRAEGEERFFRDELLQVWALHHLQIVGEAARGLSDDLRGMHPEVPWPEIVALRNILVHEYFGVNLRQVWMVLVRDLPSLRAKIELILRLADLS